jgi:hypothetical protein
MILSLTLPTENNKLILARFLNAPGTADRERSRGAPQLGQPSFENSIELVFLAGQDKVPAYSEDGRIEWDV